MQHRSSSPKRTARSGSNASSSSSSRHSVSSSMSVFRPTPLAVGIGSPLSGASTPAASGHPSPASARFDPQQLSFRVPNEEALTSERSSRRSRGREDESRDKSRRHRTSRRDHEVSIPVAASASASTSTAAAATAEPNTCGSFCKRLFCGRRAVRRETREKAREEANSSKYRKRPWSTRAKFLIMSSSALLTFFMLYAFVAPGTPKQTQFKEWFRSESGEHPSERVELTTQHSRVLDGPQQPLIPGTTPFTIVALLRDMKSADELASSEATMDNRAYQDELAQHAFQMNALFSWTRLVAPRHIIIFMDTEASCHKLLARPELPDLQCFVIPCWHPIYRKPLLDCVFHVAHKYARTELMAYVNGDVVLGPSLVHDVHKTVQSLGDNFLLVSRRSDTFIPQSMIDNYASMTNVPAILEFARTNGVLHSGFGIDLFVYPRSLFRFLHFPSAERKKNYAHLYPPEYDLAREEAASDDSGAPLNFPPFLAGVYRWDNWLLSEMILHEEVSVVDVTRTGLLVHQVLTDKNRVPHPERTGATWNDVLVKKLTGNSYQLGQIENANYLLSGACPECELQANNRAAIEVLLRKRSTRDSAEVRAPTEDGTPAGPVGPWLAVISASSLQAQAVDNWLCWAARHKFKNFVFLAQDLTVARQLHSHGIPVVTADGAPETSDPGDSLVFLTWKTKFLTTALKAFHVVHAGVDTVWPQGGKSLFHHLSYGPKLANSKREFWASAAPAGTHPPRLEEKVFAVKSTKFGQYFWNQVILCVEAALTKLREAGAREVLPIGAHPLGTCMYEKSKQLKGKLPWGPLDPLRFPSTNAFFEVREPQMNGVLPLVIDASDLEHSARWPIMSTWGLVATSSGDHSDEHEAASFDDTVDVPPQLAIKTAPVDPKLHCATFPAPDHQSPGLLPASSAPAQSFFLKIRVLTYARVVPLKRLLASLMAANYLGDRVSLEISVDRPANLAALEVNDPLLADYTTVVDLCRATEWSHGEFTCTVQQKHIGLTGQWTTGWSPKVEDGDRELLLVLEDDVSVVADFYAWLKQCIEAYYLDPQQYDPRMFGLSLQTQHTILGEASGARYGKTTPYATLGEADSKYTMYRYQLVGTWGAVFFPQQWRDFQAWLLEVQFDAASGTSLLPGFTPCVPNSIGNAWWARAPTKVWSQWFVRFAFEQGYYGLYTNFPDRASLVVNYRAAGLNFEDDRGASNPPLIDLTERLLTFPPLADLPLFDFSFRRVQHAELLPSIEMTPPPPVGLDACWTQNDFKKLDTERKRVAAAAALVEKERARVEARQIKLAGAEAALFEESAHTATLQHMINAHESVLVEGSQSTVAKQWEKDHPGQQSPTAALKARQALHRAQTALKKIPTTLSKPDSTIKSQPTITNIHPSAQHPPVPAAPAVASAVAPSIPTVVAAAAAAHHPSLAPLPRAPPAYSQESPLGNLLQAENVAPPIVVESLVARPEAATQAPAAAA